MKESSIFDSRRSMRMRATRYGEQFTVPSSPLANISVVAESGNDARGEGKRGDVTTVILADDHHIVRRGLKALLEGHSDLRVVGEASDGLEATKLAESMQPDIMVLDLMMGSVSGLEVARQLAKRSPKTNVIIFSMYDSEAYVHEALHAGAKAYVLKGSNPDELVHAIRQVATGHRYLSPPLSERAIEAYTARTEAAAVDPYDTLTTRELEVLHMAAQANTNAEIARKLCISRRTVEVHRANVMRKLSLHTQADLIRYALQRGILPSDISTRQTARQP